MGDAWEELALPENIALCQQVARLFGGRHIRLVVSLACAPRYLCTQRSAYAALLKQLRQLLTHAISEITLDRLH
jgi:hypothetical protein